MKNLELEIEELKRQLEEKDKEIIDLKMRLRLNINNDNLEFIKNIVDIEVDGLKGLNNYTIKAMYNKKEKDGFATITYKLVDEFSLTWGEIEEEGGAGAVMKDIKDTYNIA